MRVPSSPSPYSMTIGLPGTTGGINSHICFTGPGRGGNSAQNSSPGSQPQVQPVPTGPQTRFAGGSQVSHGPQIPGPGAPAEVDMAGSSRSGGSPCPPPRPQTLNLTTGRAKWSSDRPRSITRSGQRNSGSPGGSSGRASGEGGRETSQPATPRRKSWSPREAREAGPCPGIGPVCTCKGTRILVQTRECHAKPVNTTETCRFLRPTPRVYICGLEKGRRSTTHQNT